MIEVELTDIVVRVATEPPEAEPPELLSPLRMVLLREKGGTRQLCIWIGAFEGDALALQRAGEQTPRPMTHDLMARMLDAVEARVERVAITELRENTFYALVTVVVDGRREELDARPSDAINLAVRLGAPIFVADEVMAESGSRERLEDEWERFCPPEELERPGGLRSLTPELVRALWPKPPEPKEP